MTTTQDTKATVSDNIITGDTKKKFRLVAKNIALTYPRCTLTKEFVYDNLMTRFSPTQLMVSEEKHQDGTPHIHAFMNLRNKPNFKDPHFADIQGFHGNYKAAHDKVGWQTYIMKDGNYKMSTDFLGLHWRGFRNEKADFDAWIKYNQDKKNIDPFPFTLPDGKTIVKKPEAKDKKCNYVIISQPNFGKTPWVQDTFENKKVYARTDETTYPFDDYNGEDIIIYDDVLPKLGEILQASNIYKINQCVYGNTRYNKKYWPKGQRRMLIILCNNQRTPEYFTDDAFINRFNFIYLNKPYIPK